MDNTVSDTAALFHCRVASRGLEQSKSMYQYLYK